MYNFTSKIISETVRTFVGTHFIKTLSVRLLYTYIIIPYRSATWLHYVLYILGLNLRGCVPTRSTNDLLSLNFSDLTVTNFYGKCYVWSVECRRFSSFCIFVHVDFPPRSSGVWQYGSYGRNYNNTVRDYFWTVP